MFEFLVRDLEYFGHLCVVEVEQNATDEDHGPVNVSASFSGYLLAALRDDVVLCTEFSGYPKATVSVAGRYGEELEDLFHPVGKGRVTPTPDYPIEDLVILRKLK